MLDRSKLPTLTLSWLGWTLLIGAAGGLAVGWLFFPYSWSVRSFTSYAGTGMIFSIVTWSGSILGCHLLALLPDRGSPGHVAGRFFVGWACIFTACLFLAAFLIRHLLGINMFNRANMGVSLLIGLSIAGFIMGFQFLRGQIRISRELALAQARAQALTLRAQLSPHTLFNSLNTVASLIPEQPGLAEESVMRLSRLMRRILAALEQEHWSLEEEFALIRDLLEMEQARFGDRLAFHLELPEADRERPVPPLLLLPLVENSLKHGFRAKVGACRLEVRVDGSRITVVDDGVGLTRNDAAGALDGVGLRTVRQRLEAIGGQFQWLPTEVGARCEVRLP